MAPWARRAAGEAGPGATEPGGVRIPGASGWESTVRSGDGRVKFVVSPSVPVDIARRQPSRIDRPLVRSGPGTEGAEAGPGIGENDRTRGQDRFA